MSEEPEIIGKVNTPCKYCTFAIWNDKTQIGCNTGRLEKFKTAKVDIVECYDDDSEFYVISGRNCNYFRHNSIPIDNMQDAVKSVKSEEKFQADLILMAPADLERLENEVGELKSWTTPPKTLIIINNLHETKTILDLIATTKYQGRWKIITKQADHVDLWEASKKCESKWFVLGNPTKLPKDFLDKLDILLNDKMERFVHIYDKHFSLYNLNAYKHIACAKDAYPSVTFRKLNEEQKGDMVKKWSDFENK